MCTPNPPLMHLEALAAWTRVTASCSRFFPPLLLPPSEAWDLSHDPLLCITHAGVVLRALPRLEMVGFGEVEKGRA